MPQMAFTKLAADKIQPPTRDEGQLQFFERLKKGLTLVLCVSYGGTKTWRALFYVGGKPRSRRLGTYPTMSVAQARDAAFEFDPERAIASSDAGSFKKIAENWVREYVEEKRLRSQGELKRQLATYVYPAWEGKPIFDIRRLDVNKLLDSIKNKHGRSQADAVLTVIRGVMTWYATQDDRYNSPIVPKMKRDQRSSQERARNRILTDEEIRAVWSACDDLGSYGALVKMLLLTGQRLRKVASMRWADLDDGTWTIRIEHREKGHAGVLKLPPLALDVLKPLPRLKGNPHVFPASHGSGEINSFSQRKAELDAKLSASMYPWVIHDLRRTARSLMARATVPDHIAERTLGHAIRGVEGVYNRHAYAEEKGDALDRLAMLITHILIPPEGSNVVPMRR